MSSYAPRSTSMSLARAVVAPCAVTLTDSASAVYRISLRVAPFLHALALHLLETAATNSPWAVITGTPRSSPPSARRPRAAERLEKLIVAGVDVMRLNMAHGTGEWVTSLVKRIREVSVRVQRHVAVMMDVKGPEIRTGVVAEPMDLEAGDPFELYTEGPTTGLRGRRRQLRRSAAGHRGRRDGAGRQRADSHGSRREERDVPALPCAPRRARLGSRRHINLPGVDVNLPSLTEKDERDIRVGVEAGCDFFALSFVRRRDDILVLRALLDHLGSKRPDRRQDRGSERRRQPRRHRRGRRRRHGGPRRPGHRDRLSHPPARSDAHRRSVPRPRQAGHHRHASARVDDPGADADARGDLGRLDRRARARRCRDALRRNDHRAGIRSNASR